MQSRPRGAVLVLPDPRYYRMAWSSIPVRAGFVVGKSRCLRHACFDHGFYLLRVASNECRRLHVFLTLTEHFVPPGADDDPKSPDLSLFRNYIFARKRHSSLMAIDNTDHIISNHASPTWGTSLFPPSGLELPLPGSSPIRQQIQPPPLHRHAQE